jgi:acetyl-CoA synthetase
MNPEDPTPHLDQFATYEEACREFRQQIPERFNIATAVCRRPADAVTRVAISEVRQAAGNIYTFGALDFLSDKFATVLADSGVTQGDVVAVMVRQSAALVVAHFGALKVGAVVQPLQVATEITQIRTLLEASRARVLVVEEEIRDGLPEIPESMVFVASDNIHSHVVGGQDRSFWREVYEAPSDFITVATASISPAFFFSSMDEGGSIKHVLHSHSALPGNLAAFEMANNFDLSPDSVLWTSTDWSAAGTLLSVIYPAWYYGLPVIAHQPSNLTIEESLRQIESCHVTVAHLPPSPGLWDTYPESHAPSTSRLKRLVVSGLPSPHLVAWAGKRLKLPVSIVHSTVEAGALAATCETWFQNRESSVGKPVPGRAVEILDVKGTRLPRGERGRIAIGLPDPAMFLGYLEPSRTLGEAPGDRWYLSEQFGHKDEDGYLVL